MSDSIYDQVLSIATTQLTTLIRAIDPAMLTETLEPREFDWDDIDNYPGVSLRYTDDGPAPATQMASTNASNAIGFPVYLVMVSPKSKQRTNLPKLFERLKESVRQYYHHRRRMEDVTVDGVLPTTSTVQNDGPSPPRDFVLNNRIQIITIMCWFFEPQTA